MRKGLRYNELDELAWEYEHGCVDHEDIGDELDWYEEHVLSCSQDLRENPQYEDFAEDDETGPGIFGNELNHTPNAEKGPCACVSNGKLFGHGEADDILSLISTLLEPGRDYHFEFGFFEAK